MKIDAMEFIRRFLQHVLPTGFHKIRYYGFGAPSNRHILKALKVALIPHGKNKKIPIQLQHHTAYHNQSLSNAPQYSQYRKCPICKIGNMVVMAQIFFKKKHQFKTSTMRKRNRLLHKGDRCSLSTPLKRSELYPKTNIYSVPSYCNPHWAGVTIKSYQKKFFPQNNIEQTLSGPISGTIRIDGN
jgi:hypothetical protein